jgi:hypothetical protein
MLPLRGPCCFTNGWRYPIKPLATYPQFGATSPKTAARRDSVAATIGPPPPELSQRVLSDICSITALFRTAAGVRFKVLAIFSAPVFCRANFFRVFTSSGVQGFLFGAFAITRSIMLVNPALIAKWAATRKRAKVDQSDQPHICLSSPCRSFGAISPI